MSDLYKKAFRGYLIDHHSPDPPVVTLEKLDLEEYERFFKEANINNLMLYCKDHWGVTYYNTKVGKRHPGLKEDWIAKLRPVLEKLKIEFNAYYCLEYDTYAPKAHTEWSCLKPDGTPLKLTGRMAKWGMPCYETGYRQYVLEQLGEIVSGYRPDSLFLDIFGKSLCYCKACMDKFEKAYGYPLPVEEEELKLKNKDITCFLDGCVRDMLKEIIDKVKGIDPGIKVTINFAALYNKEIRDMLDYQFTEPWAGNWLSAAYARDTAPDGFPQLGPGDVSEVYNYQPESVYLLAASQIAANGCRVFMYSGSQHTDGTLEHEEAKRVGAAYREIEKIEEYLENRKIVADIGILQSDLASVIGNEGPVSVNSIQRLKVGSRHREALLGAMKLCDYSKYTWKVIPEQELTVETAKALKVLLLPEIYHIDQRLLNVIKEFVKAGGVLVSAGDTGLYSREGTRIDNYGLSQIYGCNYVKTVDRYASSAWGGYLKLSDDGMWENMPDTFIPVSRTRHKVEVTTGSKLSLFVDPACELSEESWVNWWCPPPSHMTEDAAIIKNCYGKGTGIFAAFDMFAMENNGFQLNREIFMAILQKHLDCPSITLDTEHRNILQYVCYTREEHNEMIIHELSSIAELTRGNTPEVDGGTLIVPEKFRKIKAAWLVYPEKIPLVICRNGDTQMIKLPVLKIHQVIRLTY
jgi:Alpha-L-fucosidase.